MKHPTSTRTSLLALGASLLLAFTVGPMNSLAFASGGGTSGGGTTTAKVDTIKVSKCYYDVPSGEMLIKASSSDPTARLYAVLPSGAILGEVQNGGGSRYGGTVMGYVAKDPVKIEIFSSSGGSIIVPTTPFQI